jgi:hypothetical protein
VYDSATYLSQRAGSDVERGKRARLWQEIAAEASREQDPNKREELAIELELALDVRDR